MFHQLRVGTMALLHSMNSARSSLQAHQRRLAVIADNIANVNTIGYKASRALFAEALALRFGLGSAAGVEVGGTNSAANRQRGRFAAVVRDLSQGTLTYTGRPWMWRYRARASSWCGAQGQMYFTRAGSFALDAAGNLVESASGAFVQGYVVQTAGGRIVRDASGRAVLSRQLGTIQIPPGLQSPPHQTERVRLSGNLSTSLAEGESVAVSAVIYDVRGGTHVLRLEFRKTATPNEFELSVTLDGSAVTLPAGASPVQFAADGTLSSPLMIALAGSELNAALGGAELFDATKSVTVELSSASNPLAGLTHFAGQSTVQVVEQDGYTAGELLGISVDAAGRLIGSFSNGRSEVLAQLVVAKFPNPEGLLRQGEHLLALSPSSGAPIFGTAGESFPSVQVVGGALEESNVDLTEEFSDLIATQRAFEAAARTMSVGDQMLVELLALRR
jgi:flagellar hook protein FlgE